MLVNTPAIVLKSFPYGDTSLISRCFSKDRGKISLIIKGARSKRSNKAAHFQPLSYIDIIYNHKQNRELHLLSKVNYKEYWPGIISKLHTVTLAMSLLELTEKTLSFDDPHPQLFYTLRDVLKKFNSENSDPNLLFWFYECALLSHLGFRPSLENDKFPGLDLPDLKEGSNTFAILASLLSGELSNLPPETPTIKDRKIISEYLWMLLCYHFDGLNNVKFIEVTKSILSVKTQK
ncbi:MAG: DNA repair protein RecO [Candidatus Marinimicrobia bacterium]|nr:DNA repair protein RecO [Candidatus Neomarinimicrobiota bacterium]|tara:strand:+ start:107 stop:808 length:702 start_codon:yes stop_codon:yes gene_type:complete